jgi:dienelactone hydrolase
VSSRPLAALAVAALALAMIGWALILLARANAGISVTETWLGPTPVRVFRPAQPPGRPGPTVVIAHGFAGSQQLMQPFAVTLARNGYLAVTFDFLGHGRNLEALAGDITRVEGATQLLVEQLAEVAAYARSLPDAGDGQSLLGHSMASDIIVRQAQRDPAVDATIAVSMFSPAVTASSPGNLLLIVGGLETFLQREALRVLRLTRADARMGVTYGDPARGTARRAEIAPGVEHVGVLYSPASMAAALNWLDAVYGRNGSGYLDRRGPAILLLLAGIIALGWPLSMLLPTVRESPGGDGPGWRGLLPAAVIPAVLTPLALWRFPADFLSVMVGGYLAVHFALYGILTWLCLRWFAAPRGGRARARGNPVAAAAATIATTAYVAGLVALVLDLHVTSFALTPPRVPLVIAMLAGTLCYFLADEALTRGPGVPRGAHLVTRAAFLLSLGLAVALSFRELFFLVIIAAVILLYFLVYGLFSSWAYRATGHPAVGAIANAVAFAWALAAVFPMLSS